jgi:hypothetical protein
VRLAGNWTELPQIEPVAQLLNTARASVGGRVSLTRGV